MIFIYALICKKTAFTYIEITDSLRRRMNEHRYKLNKGVDRAPAMIAEWQQHGESAFAMKLLETLPAGTSLAEAREAEAYWQARFAKQGLLYGKPSAGANKWRLKWQGTAAPSPQRRGTSRQAANPTSMVAGSPRKLSRARQPQSADEGNPR